MILLDPTVASSLESRSQTDIHTDRYKWRIIVTAIHMLLLIGRRMRLRNSSGRSVYTEIHEVCIVFFRQSPLQSFNIHRTGS
jgi:hypothetical protein